MISAFIIFLKKSWTHLVRSQKKRPCPCCAYLTLPEELDTFLICPICFWEDDGLQSEDPEFEGGANKCNLKTAKKNFKKFGASEERFIKNTRKPKQYEIPQI